MPFFETYSLADVFSHIFVPALIGILLAVLFKIFRDLKGFEELAFADTLPVAIWAETRGNVIWNNRAYVAVCSYLTCEYMSSSSFDMVRYPTIGGEPVRVRYQLEKEQAHFDLSKHVFRGQVFYHLADANDAARAETEQARLAKVMAETFSYLSVGIAVFDKSMELALFNPAFCEHLRLASSWLIQRPSMSDVLDRLWERGDLPEPKDFKKWRDQFLAVKDQEDGKLYLDDWNLPDGRVLHLTVRSFPRNAVAVFVEDITAQVSVETEFRKEVLRLYSTYDNLSSAIAVFNSSGELSFANHGFEEMWNTDIAHSVLVPDLNTILNILRPQSRSKGVWDRLATDIMRVEKTDGWQDMITLRNGEKVLILVSPLIDGQCLVEFRQTVPKFPARKFSGEIEHA